MTENNAASDQLSGEHAISARNLTMKGEHGPYFSDVDIDIPHGGLHIFVGPAGLWRTGLLMILSGRMKPTRGHVQVCGERRSRRIFYKASIAGFSGVDDLDASNTVGSLVTEQVRWMAPWYRLVGAISDEKLRELAAPVFGDRPIPTRRTYVADLDQLDRLLLRIVLAVIGRRPILIVDDLEQVEDDHDRAFLIDRLIELGDRFTVIAAMTNPLNHEHEALKLHALRGQLPGDNAGGPHSLETPGGPTNPGAPDSSAPANAPDTPEHVSTQLT